LDLELFSLAFFRFLGMMQNLADEPLTPRSKVYLTGANAAPGAILRKKTGKRNQAKASRNRLYVVASDSG